MFRFSLVSAISIALFWTTWHFIDGQVPEVSSIKLAENWSVNLPFPISRWWDVLMGPIWSIILVFIVLISKKIEEEMDESFIFSTSTSVFFGVVAGLAATDMIFGLAFGLAFGLVLSLAFGSLGGLTFNSMMDYLAESLTDGLKFGLSFSLGFSLIFSLAYGLILNLALGLAFGLVLSLAYGLAYGLNFVLTFGLNDLCFLAKNKLFYKNFWLKFGRWLLAE